ncbi:ankyrin repeat-containing protein BDA1-like [Macadamia integrifolia]|uniref:ankyrin repeat-containing protein BDA1-like n=1 Tax=Macadamia integrifolia TaxID=60698 RepID=UPI001C4EEEEE|nr:ankyrin repeat-containing protein BDA1-like [Macadamia integrifolia]XP_042487909.1 ankyrin repeat-containing protein BDA1-like [Macadamia integrifolia]
MDPRLIHVARNGDIDGLYTLLREDPFILENVEKIPFTDTPLHWAASIGHTCFVKEIINLKPSFIMKLNQDGFSPLHLASISGHLEIINLVLKEESGRRLGKLKEAMYVDGGLCNLKGRENRTPFHCAVIAGNIDALEELFFNDPNSIKALTVRKETALHLALKFDQVETFKVMMSWLEKYWHNDILSWKDHDGNTILHLAASRGQYEIVELLVHGSGLFVRNAIQVNAINNDKLTALDLVMHLPSDQANQERIRSTLCRVGAKGGQDISTEMRKVPEKLTSILKWLVSKSKIKSVYRHFIRLKVDRDTPLDTRNALLVVVVLIVTATYQTGLNPPGGYWQDDKNSTFDNDGNLVQIGHSAGQPIWFTKATTIYNLVMLFNFAGFLLSVVLVYNLTVGFPLRGPLLLALLFMLLTNSWSTPIDYNGPSGADYSYFSESYWWSGNMMSWLPVVLVVIIWTMTANWMAQIWWKLLLLTGLVKN